MMKYWKWLTFFLMMAGCTKMGFEYQGKICEKIFPGVGGEMRLIRGSTPQDTKIMIFQPDTPAPVQMADYELPKNPKNLENFNPPFKEAWMEDAGETLNHESNRLIVSDLKGNYKILFHEYGQRGWWWISPNLKKIHILGEFTDFTKRDQVSMVATIRLNLWTSFDGGQTFLHNEKFAKQVGIGRGSGMVFDHSGYVGYVFVDSNIVWQIIDGGLKFRKHFIPHTTLPPFPTKDSTDGVNKDAAMVDNHRNLLYALFEPMKGDRAGANIYEIGETETRTDLVQDRPRYSFPGKRIVAMSRIPDREGFYMFYLECGKDRSCNWSNHKDKLDKNPSLHFGLHLEGQELKTGDFGFFLKIQNIYVGNNGDIAVTANMQGTRRAKLMVSHDYGRHWKIQDLSHVPGMAANFADFDHKEFWLQSSSFASPDNQIYKTKLP